jgi:hypothetical protein
MLLKNQDIVFMALLPQTATPSAHQRLAEYTCGYNRRRRHKLSSKEATAQPRTSYMEEESRTHPTPARPTSTK